MGARSFFSAVATGSLSFDPLTGISGLIVPAWRATGSRTKLSWVFSSRKSTTLLSGSPFQSGRLPPTHGPHLQFAIEFETPSAIGLRRSVGLDLVVLFTIPKPRDLGPGNGLISVVDHSPRDLHASAPGYRRHEYPNQCGDRDPVFHRKRSSSNSRATTLTQGRLQQGGGAVQWDSRLCKVFTGSTSWRWKLAQSASATLRPCPFFPKLHKTAQSARRQRPGATPKSITLGTGLPSYSDTRSLEGLMSRSFRDWDRDRRHACSDILSPSSESLVFTQRDTPLSLSPYTRGFRRKNTGVQGSSFASTPSSDEKNGRLETTQV